MATILPRDLPPASTLPSNTAIPVDGGSQVEKATPQLIVDTAIPLASQEEAEAGANNTKRMTPLRVKQAMDANMATTAALASPDPGKGAEMVALNANQTVKARLLQTTFLTDEIASGTDAGPALNKIVSDIGGETGELGFGGVTIPNGTWEMSETLLSESQSLQLVGLGSPLIQWNGAAGDYMFQFRDSSFASLSDLVLLNSPTDKAAAAIYYDDTNGNNIVSGTNENLHLSSLRIGRRWGHDAGNNAGFATGILIGGPNNANNDKFVIEQCAIWDSSSVGIDITNSQSVWGAFRDVRMDTCGIGLKAGSNTQSWNLMFNRNTQADFSAFRDTIHHIWGFNSENAKLLIDQTFNASVFVYGGKALLSATHMTGDYWAQFAGTKDVVFQDFLVDPGNTTGKRVKFDASSAQRGRITVRGGRFPSGDSRAGYELNAGTGTCGLLFDIEQGEFRARGRLDGSQTYDPASMADGDSLLVSQAMGAGAGIVEGDPYLVSFSTDLDSVMLTGNCYDNNLIYARFNNESGTTKDLASGKLRWRKLQAHEIKARGSKTFDQSSLATGNGETTTVSCPCALGDFVYWAYTTDDRAASKSAYVSGANTVAVRFQNQSGTTSNPAPGTLNVFVVREEAFDFMGATMADPASLADGAGEDILVPVPGARKGDHALAAFSLDLQGISHSVEIYADDTARVRLQNETGGTIDLAAMQVRVGAFIALG
jgi:hypothetical protein